MGVNQIQGHDTEGRPVPVRVNTQGYFIFGADDLQVYVEEVSAAQSYIGLAAPGTLTSAAAWQIKRSDEVGILTTIKYADAAPSYDKIWDNRAGYAY